MDYNRLVELRAAWLGILFALAVWGQSQVQTVAGGILPNRVAGTPVLTMV